MVMAEFGGSLADEIVEAEAAREEIMTPDHDMSSGTTRDAIKLEEVQSWPQRTPRPLVSLVHTRMRLANQM